MYLFDARDTLDKVHAPSLVPITRAVDVNPLLKWADLDFDIPARLTAGRSEIDVALDATQSPTPWTAFGYTALSYVAPGD